MLIPQTMAIIIATFPADRRGAALGVWGAVAGVASDRRADPRRAAGHHCRLAVDLLRQHAVRRARAGAGGADHPAGPAARAHRIDRLGVLIATGALICLAFALTEGERFDWNGWIWRLLALAAVLLVVLPAAAAGPPGPRAADAVRTVRDRNFALINVRRRHGVVRVIGMFLPLTLYLQSVLGFTALKAGLVLAPSSLVVDGPCPGGRGARGQDRREVHPDGRPGLLRDRGGLDRDHRRRGHGLAGLHRTAGRAGDRVRWAVRADGDRGDAWGRRPGWPAPRPG